VAASSTVLLHQSIDEHNKVGHAGGTAGFQPVPAAGLQQEDTSILRQARGEHATRAASADDDEIVA
jgi:hypothetical protein